MSDRVLTLARKKYASIGKSGVATWYRITGRGSIVHPSLDIARTADIVYIYVVRTCKPHLRTQVAVAAATAAAASLCRRASFPISRKLNFHTSLHLATRQPVVTPDAARDAISISNFSDRFTATMKISRVSLMRFTPLMRFREGQGSGSVWTPSNLILLTYISLKILICNWRPERSFYSILLFLLL